MNYVLAALVAFVGLFCIFAVFYDGFKDSFGQRVGLAVMTVSLYPIGAQLFRQEDIGDGATISLTMGLLIFLVSTAVKLHKANTQAHSPHTPVHH